MVRRAVSLGVIGALALMGCESTMSPKAVSTTHAACAKKIADGTFRLERMKSVGKMADRTPPGTPVVVYGLAACGACNLAASYLEQRGIPYVRKNVARPPNNNEMRMALGRASLDMETRDLPVIDVRGVVTIGFTPCAIDAAWEPATTPAPLPAPETDAGPPVEDAGIEEDGGTAL